MLSPRIRIIASLVLLLGAAELRAQVNGTPSPRQRTPQTVTAAHADDTPREVLSEQEWRQVDKSVDRGLTFLAAQQQPDGSFPSDRTAQPGVTSLCVLAFMAHGHNPGTGPYGEQLDRAVKYITSCQKQNGLLMLLGNNEPEINRAIAHEVGVAGTYDHAISSLTLCELYGMTQDSRYRDPAQLAVDFAQDIQAAEGGWRYQRREDSDMSVTGWFLMGLQSARMSGLRRFNGNCLDHIASPDAYLRIT